MSIVNISSENALENKDEFGKNLKEDGVYNNSEFTVKFKKPLNDCVGVQLLRAAIPLTYNVINENADVDNNLQNVLRFVFHRTTNIGILGAHLIESTPKVFNVVIKSGTYSDEQIEDLCDDLEYKLRLIDSNKDGTYNSLTGAMATGAKTADIAGLADIETGPVNFLWGDDTGGAIANRAGAVAAAMAGEYSYTDAANSWLVYYDDNSRRVNIIHKAKQFTLLGYNYVHKKDKEDADIQKELVKQAVQVGLTEEVYPVTRSTYIPIRISSNSNEETTQGLIWDNELASREQATYDTQYGISVGTFTDEEDSLLEDDVFNKYVYIGTQPSDVGWEPDSSYSPSTDVFGYRNYLAQKGPSGFTDGDNTYDQATINNHAITEFERALSAKYLEILQKTQDDPRFDNPEHIRFRDLRVRTLAGNLRFEWKCKEDYILINDDYYATYLPLDFTATGVSQTLYNIQREVYNKLFRFDLTSGTDPTAVLWGAVKSDIDADYFKAQLIMGSDIETSNHYDFHSQTAAYHEATIGAAKIVAEAAVGSMVAANESFADTARQNRVDDIIADHAYKYTTPSTSGAGAARWKANEDLLATYPNKVEVQNSGRLQKVFGYYFNDFPPGLATFKTPAGEDSPLLPAVNGTGNVAILTSHLAPEPRGSKALFLRLKGATLDQQNTETTHGDRIMIPLTQPHGSVEHYIGNTQSEVIPFKLPQTLDKLTLRLEYGDENSLVGGTHDSLNGAHAYYRFKFYFKHQTNKL